VPDDLEVDPDHRVTPIDLGDVCVNYDRAFFAAAGAPPVPPRSRTSPTPRTPACSPWRTRHVVARLAFVAATVERLGDPGWETWWASMRANGVTVAHDWTDAYYGEFSGGATSEGDKPLVVSYASSPAAEIDPSGDASLTGIVEDTCVRQVEYAGVLDGATNPDGARALIDFSCLSGSRRTSRRTCTCTRSAMARRCRCLRSVRRPPADPIEVDPSPSARRATS
jgi:thiamine transport system substrate-binding protein